MNWSRPHRLKKEALQFFKEDLATRVMNVEDWKQKYNIDPEALEEIEQPYITYGRKNLRESYESGDLAGWSNDENDAAKDKNNKKRPYGRSYFCFTINFPSVRYEEHDRFSKGRLLQELMRRFQREADNFFKQFAADEIDEFGNEKKEE